MRNGFSEALNIKSNKRVEEPYDKQSIKRGAVYLAPANYHMSVELGNSLSLTTDEMMNNSRPAIDVLFSTAASVYRDKLIGILLSGANKDGAIGMATVKKKGGCTIIQNPQECLISTMPEAAKNATEIDYTLNVEQIIALIQQLYNQLKRV